MSVLFVKCLFFQIVLTVLSLPVVLYLAFFLLIYWSVLLF